MGEHLHGGGFLQRQTEQRAHLREHRGLGTGIPAQHVTVKGFETCVRSQRACDAAGVIQSCFDLGFACAPVKAPM